MTKLYAQAENLETRLELLYFSCEDDTRMDEIYRVWKHAQRRTDRRWKRIKPVDPKLKTQVLELFGVK